MSSAIDFEDYDTREQASAAVCRLIAEGLRQDIEKRGTASLLLSGGSTPKAAYAALADENLDWDKVKVTLVDDRWVGLEDPGSNEAMIRSTLMQGGAKAAELVSLKTDATGPDGALEELTKRLDDFSLPHSVVIMGMGTDGHTASWFPGSEGLEAALDQDSGATVCAINAEGAPVAGDYPERITLSLPFVMNARQIILFITGEEKRAVFDAAPAHSVSDRPVNALRSAGERLKVIWAP